METMEMSKGQDEKMKKYQFYLLPTTVKTLKNLLVFKEEDTKETMTDFVRIAIEREIQNRNN
jgi:hypothetical protein